MLADEKHEVLKIICIYFLQTAHVHKARLQNIRKFQALPFPLGEI